MNYAYNIGWVHFHIVLRLSIVYQSIFDFRDAT